MNLIQDYPHFLHGGDYNPDQWLEEPQIIDDDFRLMEEACCNTFSVGIFSWSQLEIEEGKFEFGWLDDIFDRAERSGKKLFLATPSAAKPAWLGYRYAETNQMNADGVRSVWHGRQSSCLSSPVFREKVARIDRELARRYGRRKTLAAWHVSNEYSTECFCPLCIAGFQQFLKRKYRTIDNLNRCYWGSFWGHRISDWSEVNPRDNSCNSARLDWKRFLTWLHVDFYQQEVAALRLFSDRPALTNMMGLFGLLDYWKFAPVCDFIADDCYPEWFPGKIEETAAQFSALHDMHYAMKQRPFLIMECCPGTVNYKKYMRVRRPNELQREHLLAIGHGADGTMYFQWRKGLGEWEQFHGAVLGHENSSRTRTFQDVASYGKKLVNIEAVLGSTRNPETALILDWESRWALALASGFGGPEIEKTDRTIFDHYRSLWHRNYELAVIDSEQDFSSYKVLTAPMLYLFKAGVREKLKAFVEAGGTVVLTYLSGYVDENNCCFRGGNPGGTAFRELCGVWNEEIDGLTPGNTQSFRWKGKTFPVTGYAELLHGEGAEILAEYCEDFLAGTPAVTVKQFGRGRIYYLGARTGLEFLEEFYCEVLTQAGVKPVMEALPPQVVVSRRHGETGDFYFPVNLSAEPVTVKLPEKMIDLWNGETVPRESVTLPEAGSTVLFLPCAKSSAGETSQKR